MKVDPFKPRRNSATRCAESSGHLHPLLRPGREWPRHRAADKSAMNSRRFILRSLDHLIGAGEQRGW
jgi:hypothetical protein